MSSEKQALLEQPSFVVRQVSSADAASIVAIDAINIKTSLSATRGEPASLKERERDLAALRNAGLVHLIADSSATARAKAHAHGPKAVLHTVVAHVEDQKHSSTSHGLGYVHLLPYKATRACYGETAQIDIVTLAEPTLGPELTKSVMSALLEEAMSGDRIKPYRTVVAEMNYKQGQAELENITNVFLEHGFEQAGLLRGVVKKGDLLIDRITLQKMV